MTQAVLLPPSPDSVSAARRFVSSAMPDLPAAMCEIVELLVSELATNCVVHARSEFLVRVQTSPGSIRVEVADAGTGEIAPREIDATQPHGRGLRIVSELADEWGVLSSPDGGRRTVWFRLSAADAESPGNA